MHVAFHAEWNCVPPKFGYNGRWFVPLRSTVRYVENMKPNRRAAVVFAMTVGLWLMGVAPAFGCGAPSTCCGGCSQQSAHDHDEPSVGSNHAELSAESVPGADCSKIGATCPCEAQQTPAPEAARHSVETQQTTSVPLAFPSLRPRVHSAPPPIEPLASGERTPNAEAVPLHLQNCVLLI